MKITIVSNELEKSQIDSLQEVANLFLNECDYLADDIINYFEIYKNLSVKVIKESEDEVILNCTYPK